MLQVRILKEVKDKTDGISRIVEVKDLDTMSTLASFDIDMGKIDLSCLKEHVGKPILVSHFIRENNDTRLDYEHEKTLKELGTDENGLQYISYE